MHVWWSAVTGFIPVLLGTPVLCLLGHAIFKLTYLSNHDYKPLYFESDAATVNEIVLKVSSAAPPPQTSTLHSYSITQIQTDLTGNEPRLGFSSLKTGGRHIEPGGKKKKPQKN